MSLFYMPRVQQVAPSGAAAEAYYLKFFEADGTTQKAVYQDDAFTTPHNQGDRVVGGVTITGIVADANGRFPAIYTTGSYKVRYYDPDDVEIFTHTESLAGQAESFYQEITGNGSQTVFTLTDDLGTDEKGITIEKPDGTTYAPTDFTINGLSLTFNSAPATGTYKIRAPSLGLGAASAFAAEAETFRDQSESFAIAVAGSGNIGDVTTLTAATIAGADLLIFSDNSDSDVNKKTTLTDFLSDTILDQSVTFSGDNTFSGNNIFTKAARGVNAEATDAATISLDFDDANDYHIQIGGNRTLGNPANATVGQSGSIDIRQDSTGSRTLAYAWGWQFPNGVTPVLTTTACGRDTLYYDVKVAQSSTVTITIASPGVVTYASHGLYTGQKIQITTTGALPTGLTASTTYYVIEVDANSFQLATSLANAAAGTAINTSGTQSGVHTLTALTINANLNRAFS